MGEYAMQAGYISHKRLMVIETSYRCVHRHAANSYISDRRLMVIETLVRWG